MKHCLFLIVSILLVLAVSSCSHGGIEPTSSSQPQTMKTTPEILEVDQIEIVDFHGTRRCYSCETIERYTRETLDEFFSAELDARKIVFHSINGDLPENKEIVIKYQARGSSLFINRIINAEDNIREDVQVWRLIGDEIRFKSYLKTTLESILYPVSS